MTNRLFTLAWILLLILYGCGTSQPETKSTTRLMMGTLVTITTWQMPPEKEAQAVAAAFAEMTRIEQLMSSHAPNTPVSHINQGPRQNWYPIPAEVAKIVQAALILQERSGGAFDPGLLPLIRLWGLDQDPYPTTPPDPEKITAWLDHHPPQGKPGLSLRQVSLAQNRTEFQIRLENETVGLDLGAIAKGYAIDQAMAKLRQQGVDNAIINAGGDLRLIGAKGKTPWRIGVQHPRLPDQAIGVSELSGDHAMVTSGDYERFFEYQGVRYHHLFDPATGKPARSGLISVSVQGKSTQTADALATAIFVLGAEKGLALVKSFPGYEALVIQEDLTWQATSGYIGAWLGEQQTDALPHP